MKDPLLDKNFLYELDQQHIREIYAKVISLDFSENPIEEIVGRVSQGSISIDGSSAIRRTCSLTLIANRNNGEDFNLHEYYWGLSQKIRVSIGVRNLINDEYPEIIWFPQGTFLITQFNTSQNINSYNISIQGKDKMALLNGELGGNITSLSFDFGTQDLIDSDGKIISNTSLLIKDIIMEVVHEYAKEPYHNIVINDLDDVGLQLIEYRGTQPLYLIVDQNSDSVDEMVFSGTLYDRYGHSQDITSLDDSEYDHRIDLNMDNTEVPTFFFTAATLEAYKNPKTVIKCSYGDTVGYKITDLTYAGELVGQAGNPVTSACLDKIVQMLGDFEYFYNLDGQFVFQKKKTYINTSFNNLKNSESDFIPVLISSQEELDAGTYYIRNTPGQFEGQETISLEAFVSHVSNLYESQFAVAKVYSPKINYYKRVFFEKYSNNAVETSSIIYSFENSNLVTAFQNNPKLSDIKNDFSIWGTRKSVDGSTELPVHMRYAIDKKPKYYKNYAGKIFITKDYWDNLKVREENKYNFYDWRELIYQMASDNSIYGHEDDFLPTIRKNNIDYFPTGYTGYEQYYTDVLSFWRDLYDPDYRQSYKYTPCSEEEFNKNIGKYYYFMNCRKKEFDESELYYVLDKTLGYLRAYNLTEEYFNNHPNLYYIPVIDTKYDEKVAYYSVLENPEYDEYGWKKTIKASPETLNFWFDFLDTDGQLSQYSCHLIGDRPKAINDNKVKSIYFRETPTVILVEKRLEGDELKEQRQLKPGYTFLYITPELKNLFTISGQGQSAQDKLQSMLYNDACCAENITLTALPVYYLEPNTRIFVRDDESGINGEYIVSKISYNLGKAETMSISAVKAVERIY